MQQKLSEIKTLGANVVAISPEMPDRAFTTSEQNRLGFEVLSDRNNDVARQFGLVFTLPERLRPIYEGFGFDLPAANGDTSYELPVPATYIISKDNIIIEAFVDADYTNRLEPERILEVLQKTYI